MARPDPARASKSRAATARSRGITLLEMLVVIGIVLLLLSLLIGGLADLYQAQRLKNSVARVIHLIGQARSRAVTDNAMYHVRFENRGPNDQWIGVYRFTKVSDALKAVTEGDVQSVTLGGWHNQNGPGPGPYTNLMLDKQKLDLGVYLETQYDPAKLWNSAKGRPKPLTLVHPSPQDLYYTGPAPSPYPAYPDYATGENLLPKAGSYTAEVWTPAPELKLLYFNPDGTASMNALLWIRDEDHLRWVRVWRGGLVTSGDVQRLSDFDEARLK